MRSENLDQEQGRLACYGEILKLPEKRKYFLTAFWISVFTFITFKLLYPFPDFFSDSYSYLTAAYYKWDINIWPIGYSRFLYLIHLFTYSGTAVVLIQYFLLQVALLQLFFTIQLVFKLTKSTLVILFSFFFINPLSIYLCNTINSDALFAALSIFWVTESIWLIKRPDLTGLIVQSVLLFLCFTVRNNAYYYPVVGIVTFIICRERRWFKITGILLPLVLIFCFVQYTRQAAYAATGTRQFSLFTGWQLANNGLYIYDKIQMDSTNLEGAESSELNRRAIDFFKHVNKASYRGLLENYVGNLFIRELASPLKQYFYAHFQPKTEAQNVWAWARASVVYESFGWNTIEHHPVAYARYFVWPNIRHYFLPPLSHLEEYNYGQNSIMPIAQSWFHYPGRGVKCFSAGFQGYVLLPYGTFFLLINLYYFYNMLGLLRRGRLLRINEPEVGAQVVLSVFFIANCVFSICVTVNILRYQFVPMVLLITSAFAAADWLADRRENANRAGVKAANSRPSVPLAKQL